MFVSRFGILGMQLERLVLIFVLVNISASHLWSADAGNMRQEPCLLSSSTF